MVYFPLEISLFLIESDTLTSRHIKNPIVWEADNVFVFVLPFVGNFIFTFGHFVFAYM